MKRATIGLRAKTGRAIAVVLTGPIDAPEFAWRGELSLVDPAVPATAEPYHQVMELPWSEATVQVQKFVTAIEAVASTTLARVVSELQSQGLAIRRVAVIGSPDRNLDKIGNPHIRAHAAEGALFRRVLEVGAARNHLSCRSFSEPELKKCAGSKLHLRSAAVESNLKALGKKAGPPWRADERIAATAAWLALGGVI